MKSSFRIAKSVLIDDSDKEGTLWGGYPPLTKILQVTRILREDLNVEKHKTPKETPKNY